MYARLLRVVYMVSWWYNVLSLCGNVRSFGPAAEQRTDEHKIESKYHTNNGCTMLDGGMGFKRSCMTQHLVERSNHDATHPTWKKCLQEELPTTWARVDMEINLWYKLFSTLADALLGGALWITHSRMCSQTICFMQTQMLIDFLWLTEVCEVT